MRAISFLLMFILVQSTQAQQQQPGQTASIEGVIVKLGTTEAIPRAKVTLTVAEGTGTSRLVTADGEGKFAIRDVVPGRYRLSAARDGYIQAEYGQRGPSSSGVPITLSAQQALKDVRIGMTQNAAIAGRVINRFGEPVGNANVQALRYTYQEGKRVLTPVQTVRTNDLGEFRLFWVQPGQYIVSAQPFELVSVNATETFFMTAPRGGGAGPLGGLPAQLGVGGVTRIEITGGGRGGPGAGPAGMVPPPPPPPPPPIADNPEVSLPVYYPGTTDVTRATAIDLRPGANFAGVNLTVVETRPVRIRGQVLNGGAPATGAMVSIFPRDTSAGLTVRSASVNNNGSFEFRNLAPGSYELAATINAAGPTAMIVGTPLGAAAGVTMVNAGAGQGRTPGGLRMAVRTQVDVIANDIDGVTLALDPGFNLNGTVAIDGRTDPALANIRIQLQADPNIPPLVLLPANLDSNGAFVVEGVTTGTYRLAISGMPRNTYVKSARLGGVDILNGGLRIDGSPRGALDIALGTSPGTLDATVLDDRQMPVSAVTVVLVPDAQQQKRFDIYRNATTDSSGRIHLEGVVPGDYKVYAWEDVEANAWTDPDYMRNHEGRGTSVRIEDGGRAAVDVKVIPYKVN